MHQERGSDDNDDGGLVSEGVLDGWCNNTSRPKRARTTRVRYGGTARHYHGFSVLQRDKQSPPEICFLVRAIGGGNRILEP